MKNEIKLLVLIALAIIASFHSKAQDRYSSADYLFKFDKKQKILILSNYYSVRDYFEEAYYEFPDIPRGILEAVAFQYSRFSTKKHETGCSDEHNMPTAHTIMGLTIDGKGVFRENCQFISELTGFSENELLNDDRIAVKGYASAFSELQKVYGCYGDSVEIYKQILVDLCELPLDENVDKDFAVNSFLYMVYYFLDCDEVIEYGIPKRKIDFRGLFGDELKYLRSENIRVISAGDTGSNVTAVSDYSGAIFNAAASCNYTPGRGGNTITSVAIHYTQGSYAGSIAWFKNCSAKVSAHYVIRSADGQVTQMVREDDKAWHVGSANGYTIGVEHEAMGDIVSYFTSAMYQSSADLVRDICGRRNLSTHRVFYRDTLDDGTVLNDGLHSLGGATACTQIRGHQHYPNQTHTDPGRYWDWNLYYKLLNPAPDVVQFSDSTGVFTDSGGENGNYTDDERKLYSIHVDGANSITLSFSSFDLEPDYDFLWIYAGNSVFSPLVGRWNTQSPGEITIEGEDILVEFRSDCGTVAPGWKAVWHANLTSDNGGEGGGGGTEPGYDEEDEFADDVELPDDDDDDENDQGNPMTHINHNVNDWITRDFTVVFSDNDDVGIKWKFYQIMESDGLIWAASSRNGFLCDNFDNTLDQSVWVNNYTNPWEVLNGTLSQTNSSADRSGIAARINGSVHSAYLYDFYLKFNSQGKCSFFFNCNNAPSLTTYFTGYEICFDKNDRSVSLYRQIIGAKRLLKKIGNISYLENTSYFYRVVLDTETGEILLKRHANTIFKVTDGVLATTPYSYIGFVTGYASVNIDNLRVYGSRGGSVAISVGAADTCKMRTQAVYGASRTKLKSVVVDKAYKFSSLSEKMFKVDYTAPSQIENLEISFDDVTLGGNTVRYINASWEPSTDNQSGIGRYYHSNALHPLGSMWNDNGMSMNCNHCYVESGNNITFTVVAENKAGVKSAPKSITLSKRVLPSLPKYSFANLVVIGTKVLVNTAGDVSEACKFELYDIAGRLLKQGCFYGEVVVLDDLTSGIYLIRVSSDMGVSETHKFAIR